jgi:soluble lytic murein transglycosylase-like protein
LQKFAYDLSNENNISYELVLSVLYNESRFNPKAINTPKIRL